MSFSLTGPFTFLTMLREVSSKNSTLTCVTPPRDPVLPITLITLANVTGVFVSLNIVSKNSRKKHLEGENTCFIDLLASPNHNASYHIPFCVNCLSNTSMKFSRQFLQSLRCLYQKSLIRLLHYWGRLRVTQEKFDRFSARRHFRCINVPLLSHYAQTNLTAKKDNDS